MYSFLNKYGQALAFGLGVLITIIFLGSALGSDAISSIGPSSEDVDKYNSTLFNFGIGAAIFLTIAAFIAAVVFGLFQVISSPKASIKGIIGLGIVALLMIVGYSMAPGEVDHETIQVAKDKFESAQGATLTPGNLKFIGGSIITALVMLAVSFVVLIGFGIRNFLK